MTYKGIFRTKLTYMYKKQRKNFQMTVKMIISDHVLGNILRTIEKRNWTLPSNIAPSMFIKVKVFKDPHNTRSLSDFSHFVYLIVDGE